MDASLVVEYLTDGGDGSDAAAAVLSGEGPAMAPELIFLEAIQSIRSLLRGQVLSQGAAELALERLHDLRLFTYPHLPLLDRVWELRDNLSTYDASYLALAELMGERIVTSDRGLATVAERVLGADRVDFLR